MSKTRRIARNIIWNWSGHGVAIVVGFIVMPYLVGTLGDTSYGLWILISSVTSYFNQLDFGVRNAVGRFIAFHRGRGEWDRVNEVVSTAFAILWAVAAVILLILPLLPVLFFALFKVPEEQVAAVRLALWLAGLNLALTFPISTFDGTLWAHERFDLLNIVDITNAVLRAALTFALIRDETGLVTLAVITLSTTILGGGAKAVLSLTIGKELRIGPRQVARAMARQLWGFGFWTFIIHMGKMLTEQMNPLVIGRFLGVELVTPYSIGKRLIAYADQVIWTATGVMSQTAAALAGKGDRERLRALLLEGCSYWVFGGLFFAVPFLLLGDVIIEQWMRRPIPEAALVLRVLVIGNVLLVSQYITHSILNGMGRIRVLAGFVALQTAVAIGLAIALIGPLGLLGAASAISVAAAARVVLTMVYGCRQLEVPLLEYLGRVFLIPLLYAAGPAGLLLGLEWWRRAQTLGALLAHLATYALAYAAAGWFMAGPDRLRSLGLPIPLSSKRSATAPE